MCEHDKHINEHLQRAWNKYGEENCELIINYKCNNEKEVRFLEQWWLDYYFIFAKSKHNEIYNISDRDDGWSKSEETKAKLRRTLNTPEVRARRLDAQLKVLHSPEEKARRDARNMNPELRTKRSAIQKEVQNKPEVNDKRIKSLAITNAKPDVKARRSAIAKEINSRPGVLEKNRAKNKEIQSTPEMKELHSKAARGSNNRHAKLDENDVLEIRTIACTDEYDKLDKMLKRELSNRLAVTYDVTACAIERVIECRTWKHIVAVVSNL